MLNILDERTFCLPQPLTLFPQGSELYKPISLESRRYIGSKAKLTDWIMQTIASETEACDSFCDIFAGTAIVAHKAIMKYKKVIINDFLHANHVIYKAFFAPDSWNKEKILTLIDSYNALNPIKLPDNYFSKHFGGKFFEYNIAKQIGYIRENIAYLHAELTEKEYCILLATLIYNIDKIANTVGHFDAYIKKEIPHQPLQLRLIDVQSYPHVQIYQEDANGLAEHIKADIVYIDPPYNSRQYSRFYHLYETLVKWDKPTLSGVALKPPVENMSRYCTTKAAHAFEHLVSVLKAKYIVVSYNNTYQSKSNSSENKIRLEEIEAILNQCGTTQIFEHAHSFFNTGKTSFDNHKELLFITKIDEERRNKTLSSLLCRGQV